MDPRNVTGSPAETPNNMLLVAPRESPGSKQPEGYSHAEPKTRVCSRMPTCIARGPKCLAPASGLGTTLAGNPFIAVEIMKMIQRMKMILPLGSALFSYRGDGAAISVVGAAASLLRRQNR